MEIAQFKLALAHVGLHLTDKQIQQFSTYTHMVADTNRVMNLTAHQTPELIIEKGLYDSLAFIMPIWQQPLRMVDVGSGAGFPGLPLKIAYPQLQMTLLEPTLKKANFLRQVITTIGLDGIDVVSERAEVWVKQPTFIPFDLAVARAVANLPMLLELTMPLLKVDGVAMLYKGKDYLAEIAMSKHALTELASTIEEVKTLRLPTDHEQRSLLIVKKNALTKPNYPRMFSQIKKTPL